MPKTPTKLPPEAADALAYLRSSSSEYLICWMTGRHAFDYAAPYLVFSGFRTQGKRIKHRNIAFTVVFQCERCTTRRTEVRLCRTGERIAGPYYEHPEGYSRAGSGVDWQGVGSIHYAHMWETQWAGRGQEAAALPDNVHEFRPRPASPLGAAASSRP